MMRDDLPHYPLLSFALSLIPLSLAIFGTVTGTAVFRSSRVARAENRSSIGSSSRWIWPL